MKSLKSLVADIEYKSIKGSLDVDITEVIYDSRKVTEGCLFICIKGAKFDGHEAAAAAVKDGAKALLVSDDVNIKEDITIIKVDDTRKAMAYVAAAWFDHPANKLKTIGITGTKGKTTTTYLVKSILENAGIKTGLVGTIEIITGSRSIHAVNTTPESFLLQQYFAEMVENGVEAVVLEVSSQGLMMHRTDGFIFDYGIFTNLSADHIGPNEHDSFEQYRECKAMLFRQCKVGIVNGDDENLPYILENHSCQIETYGFKESNDICAKDVKLTKSGDYIGVDVEVTGLVNMRAKAPLPGRFSVYNILTTLAICRHFNVSEEDITKALSKAFVKGRIEIVKVPEDIIFIIDYAHNAMALESVLTTLKEYEPQRLVTIFGCGGNRAKDRRFNMGEVSGKYSDLTIITSDNPRDEEPADIMADIETGIKKTSGKYLMIEDREKAIEYAIKNGEAGDVVLLAGKGHEDYQEIKGVKYPMDERSLIEEAIRNLS